jgi:acyl carrier protein
MLARTNIDASVLQLLRRFAPGLPDLDVDAARTLLPDAGLTSMAAVKLMLALEAEFDIAIPDRDLTPQNFASLEAVVVLVTRLQGY